MRSFFCVIITLIEKGIVLQNIFLLIHQGLPLHRIILWPAIVFLPS